MMSKNIEGKVVVITGESSWLGEATVRLLSDLSPALKAVCSSKFHREEGA
jgi:NADP-dependent 3-hydroxy acid dehydrogenase YdfG